jgi:hypothetical protein
MKHLSLFAACVFALVLPAELGAQPARKIEFNRDVRPILADNCFLCHGPAKSARKAGLRFDTQDGLFVEDVVVPGKPGKSKLWERVSSSDPKHVMPPPSKTRQPLTAKQIETLRLWIEQGAPWQKHWAFIPPLAALPPPVKDASRVKNPIDTFVLQRLEREGLPANPQAGRETLIRRVTLDLTGLPPTLKEIDDFLKDSDADAYEKVVDRLLASPHYGERWARHWLDLAGYADSEGILDADYVRTAAWRYRDYVIRAFNSDKPYDRFLQEQIAGDELVDYWKVQASAKELPADVVEALVATGYLRCASDTSRPDFVNIKNAPGYYFQTLDDTVKIVASSTMGLTVQCAKCHSHKYDPIPQGDYYRLQAIFMSGYRPGQWIPQVQRKLNEATAVQEKETSEHNAKIDKLLAPLKKEQAELKKMEKEPKAKERLPKLADEIKALEASKRTLPEIRAFYDLPGEVKTHLLKRGDYLQPGPEVQPGVLRVLANAKAFAVPERPKDAKTSGRRLAFAKWLTSPEHPLTARVFVNRLWLHHFGVGLVATPDNFGKTGAPPSHPELLDWLATEFSSTGWRIKAMHKLIVTSATYKQASAHQPALHAKAKQLDPDNRLLWRQRLRRLEGEAMRDAVLAVSSTLNAQQFGPPVPMVRSGDGEVNTSNDANGNRRSIYLQVRRSQPLTFLQLFDQPVVETNCTRRETSTVASQALTLLNSDFMTRNAAAFADRVLKDSPADPAGRALLLTFGRPPTDKEITLFAAFIEQQTQQHAKSQSAEARRRAVADLCHMLLSANEFAYID